jgi:hypothetical protein
VKRALLLVALVACSKPSPTPIHQLRFRGEGKAIAPAPGGGAVIAGGFAVETDLGAGVLRTGDDSVHGVVARLDHDGHVVWDTMIGGPFVEGIAADGDDVVLVAQAMPESRAWRIGPGGGEQWSVSFGGAYPQASTWSDDGTLYVVGSFGSSDPSTGALGLTAADGRSAWIAAIDRGGKVRWAKPFEPASYRFVVSVAVSGDRVYALSTSHEDLIVDAYDRSGARVATRTLPVDGLGASVAPLGDGVLIGDNLRVFALDRSLATRWDHEVPALVHAVATSSDGIFIGGSTTGGFTWNGVTIARAQDDENDAYVARLTLDGEPDWISVGRGKGPANTNALAASGDVVWAAGSFDGPIVFGVADPLRGEPHGIQSGFAIELKQTR